MISYFIIGLGGGLGAVFRALLTRIFPATFYAFPISILIVNVIGCFAIGILTECFAHFSSDNQFIKLFLTTGFLGGFTTFSTFSLEFGLLITRHLYGLAFLYVISSVSLSLIAFFVGLYLIKTFI